MRDISDKPFRFVRPAYQPAISLLASIFFFFFLIQSIQPSPHSVLSTDRLRNQFGGGPSTLDRLRQSPHEAFWGLVASQKHLRTEGIAREIMRYEPPQVLWVVLSDTWEDEARNDMTSPEVEAVNFKVCHENINTSQRRSVHLPS